MDRSIVTVPNSQMASITLENLSSRDAFLFHHVIGLQKTTAPELASILGDISNLVAKNTMIVAGSTRVRFIRFGQFSLDVDIFAYVTAVDWADFLRVQEVLLLGIMDVVETKGVGIAFPSQTVYLARDTSDHGAVEPLRQSASSGKAP